MKLKGVFQNLGNDGNGDYVKRNLIAKVKKKGSKKKEVTERSITKFKTSVNLKVEIDTRATKHSDERQEGRGIPDSDIRQTVFKATEKILQAFMDGSLKENVRFHIYDPGNDHLNLIATFHMNDKSTPERINVVTAIRKKGFIQRDVSKTIKV